MGEEKDYSFNGRIRGSAPPKRPGIEIEVVRVTETENRFFILLTEKPWCAFFHWLAARSVTCSDNEDCAKCVKSVPRKWRAYIHALEQSGSGSREVILELTQAALALVEVQLCGQPFRGATVKIKKTKGGAKGRYVIEVMSQRVDRATLMQEKDPQPILVKLWEINERRVDALPTIR